jgi:hypothetical protein
VNTLVDQRYTAAFGVIELHAVVRPRTGSRLSVDSGRSHKGGEIGALTRPSRRALRSYIAAAKTAGGKKASRFRRSRKP